jgi:hypothetical protein
MKNKYILVWIIFTFHHFYGYSQNDSSNIKRRDTSDKSLMNMDAVYNRPFLTFGKIPISLGGYMEVNWQYIGTDGITEGHQFQARRTTIFIASSISKKIKFLTEIELEEGGKEISLEFSSIDVEFHPLFNLRSGIVMNPIGAFNQNHDGPKWEFTDRPIAATQMLPATWSNVGIGAFGKNYMKDWMLGYEVYVTNGLDESIVDNEENKTFLPASKNNPSRFEGSLNGMPSVTGKIAIRNNQIGEVGLSYMSGVYNTFQKDGIVLDEKRHYNIWAIDFNTRIPKFNTSIIGEWAQIKVNLPDDYIQQYGRKQHGGFIDVVQPVMKRKIAGWKNSVVNISCRLEYVDWNVGKFEETSDKIGDSLWSLMPALSFRPTTQTVFRLNYRIQRQKDILNNIPSRTSGFSFGISSYF